MTVSTNKMPSVPFTLHLFSDMSNMVANVRHSHMIFGSPEPKVYGLANCILMTPASDRQHFQTSPLKLLLGHRN